MKHLKILVVDDAKSIREVMELVLCKQGHDVVTASCGEEGLEFVKANPDTDLVISDRNMKKRIDGRETVMMRGEELIRKIRSLNPRIKTIIMSAFDDADDALESTRVYRGQTAFLTRAPILT